MFELITQHQSWTAVVIYWIFSAAVSSMSEPVPKCTRYEVSRWSFACFAMASSEVLIVTPLDPIATFSSNQRRLSANPG